MDPCNSVTGILTLWIEAPLETSVEASLPFTGLWLVQNSPARRVPSHGSELFGERYAIDFVGVNEHHRSAEVTDWRSTFATEPPERFFSFGRPILSPCNGVVVAVHDSEPDHEARRSQLALVPYALGQAARVREGIGAIAGNHVSVMDDTSGVFITMVHLQTKSVCVAVGQRVNDGQQLARCGNSGNSTQPHVHIQATDSLTWDSANGVPLKFRGFLEWKSVTSAPQTRNHAIPANGSVIQPVEE